MEFYTWQSDFVYGKIVKIKPLKNIKSAQKLIKSAFFSSVYLFLVFTELVKEML